MGAISNVGGQSVTLASPPPGGDAVRDVQKIIEEYDGTNITSTQTVKNGPCTLGYLNIVQATGATVRVYDNTASSGTLIFEVTGLTITEGRLYAFHRKMTTGVQVQIGAGTATVDVLTR